MKTEQSIERMLSRLERSMAEQVEYGMEHGWPVPYWDKNCVERRLILRILGRKITPFCAADTLAGL